MKKVEIEMDLKQISRVDKQLLDKMIDEVLLNTSNVQTTLISGGHVKKPFFNV